MGEYAIGQAVPRTEDPRLLRGRGRFIDDVPLLEPAHAMVLRSPHAHALIVSINVTTACAMPGVLAVLTGADYRDDGLGGMPCQITTFERPDGTPMFSPLHPALAMDRVRRVGDDVALVVAETKEQAKDAAEQIWAVQSYRENLVKYTVEINNNADCSKIIIYREIRIHSTIVGTTTC